MAPNGFLDTDGPVAFAHRGFAVAGGENSMAAFQAAVDLGYRFLETDVRVTADGVALAFHDATLDRVTDAHGRIDRLPWSAVRRARIGGTEPIPLLSDVLATWPDVCLNLDVKSGPGVAATAAAVRATGALPRVCVGAFSARRVHAVRRLLGPRLVTGLAPHEALGLRAARGRVAAGLRGRCAQVPPRLGPVTLVDRSYLAAAHRLGVRVHVWTVNDRAEMTRLLDLGVDGVMTDRADVLRNVLRERGQWT
ncbi:glycerophosphodiester phosphodiesterase family protein [uncultured Jatrophihabitans sp.]|uniref:glycerophosphodiester phosphodiesterase family protein n=1 Tax=uncultured Jatrophihabitans sp. TaxID=1610747 RepID=UPI0035C9D38F